MRPMAPSPFTIQIGDPNTVAARTGITTVADLRGYDMAVGGQGAPLVPAFHDWLLRSEPEHRVVLNIGGIANITTLVRTHRSGLRHGPGEHAARRLGPCAIADRYDDAGNWAAQGAVSESLLPRCSRIHGSSCRHRSRPAGSSSIPTGSTAARKTRTQRLHRLMCRPHSPNSRR